jgi:hypothetical protein
MPHSSPYTPPRLNAPVSCTRSPPTFDQMTDIDPEKLALLLVAFASFLLVGVSLSKTTSQKLIIVLLLVGFFLYSGIATSDVTTPSFFLFCYVVFSACIILGFAVGLTGFARLGRAVGEFASPQISIISRSPTSNYLIAFFIILHISTLIFPDFRLHLLLSPPAPDMRLWFSGQLSVDRSADFSLLHYATTLFTPFYYVALFSLRRDPIKLISVLTLIDYLRYVDQSYIGRSEIFFDTTFVFIVLWTEHRSLRWLLTLGAVAVAPIAATGFYAYSMLRLGVGLENIDLTGAAYRLIESEFTFLIRAGMPLIDSAQHADLGRYLAWILTLPIPGFLKGGIDVARINYEMSTIVLGRGISDPNFYVLLPGLLAESIYLFGDTFFFLHAIFVGIAAAFFCRLCERVPCMSTLFTYVAILFFYNLNRGGISSLLPSVVNEFLVFYLFLGASIYRTKSSIWRALPSQHPGKEP